jgi:hypothetical protein
MKTAIAVRLVESEVETGISIVRPKEEVVPPWRIRLKWWLVRVVSSVLRPSSIVRSAGLTYSLYLTKCWRIQHFDDFTDARDVFSTTCIFFTSIAGRASLRRP